MQKLMQDIGPMQGLSSMIADEMKQMAGQKRAERNYLSSSERTVYVGLEKLQLYYETQKAEYDAVRNKAVQVLKPYLDKE